MFAEIPYMDIRFITKVKIAELNDIQNLIPYFDDTKPWRILGIEYSLADAPHYNFVLGGITE